MVENYYVSLFDRSRLIGVVSTGTMNLARNVAIAHVRAGFATGAAIFHCDNLREPLSTHGERPFANAWGSLKD